MMIARITRMTLRMSTNCETLIAGMRAFSTIARPETVPTTIPLGIRK